MYPQALLDNIAAAGLGAVNHYTVADQVLKYAEKDMRAAVSGRNAGQVITGTMEGSVVLLKTGPKEYTIKRFHGGDVLFTGDRAATVQKVACLYKLVGE